MNRAVRSLVVLMLVAAMFAAVVPAGAQTGPYVSPRGMLSNYYNTINTRQYQAAYAQWLNPPQTYASFVAGYADTTRVDAFFGSFRPRQQVTTAGAVPSILIGYRTNGSVAAYSGCYFVTYNEAAVGMGQWLLTGANIQPMAAVPVPESIPTQLAGIDCYTSLGTVGYTNTVYEFAVNYFNAINMGNYWGAYTQWSNPPQTYDQFVQGWSDTAETVLFYGLYQFGGYRAVDTGRIPVVLFGYHLDGSMVAYQGCLVLNYGAYGTTGWTIGGANLTPMLYTGTPPRANMIAALQAWCY
ncbi:MAG TPA: hypothetical protein PKD09_09700 [Aggregatilinea sp.]|uniref:hypothetical protein n=1 Tax=Aggregatilinea sp. TaxID=2806333 RepID=UPI002C83C237|nr:hypothetical protein [Aggregatilinea sp.]HML21912.1 hypothetical protein [Aggregatilinea sp.]